MPEFLVSDIRITRHAGADDLLSAGLGLDGLRQLQPPAPVDANAPTPSELRRRAIHANWRGIVDLAPGAFGDAYGSVPNVPGREFQAFARVPGASHPHRVLAQIPAAFDRSKRCLVVAPASGSRGVYGAIGFAGSWALPRGCAVVYTDKGAGTGVFDFDGGTGVALDGTRAARGAAILEFDPGDPPPADAHRIAFKHAHSRDNPEADWGRHVVQAMHFGLHALALAFPEQAPFTPQNTRIIATALSNGGGAVLRAAEHADGALFDAVVAVAPNISVEGARSLFDYGTDAAVWQVAALADPHLADAARLTPAGVVEALAAARCTSLAAAGLIAARDPAAQAAEAYAHLRAGGWEDGALQFAGVNLALDLWRALGTTYVSAYARTAATQAPCGFAFAALDGQGRPRATTPAERALWWSDGQGIAPMATIGIVDEHAQTSVADPTFAGVRCLRLAWDGDGEPAPRLHEGVAATRASARLNAPWTLIVHGQDDGLIPIAFNARPYAAAARAHNGALRFWEVPRAQHFDAFLAIPALRARHVALLPHAHRALDHAWAAISERREPPPDGVIGVP